MNNNYEAGWKAFHEGKMSTAINYFEKAIEEAKNLLDKGSEMEAKLGLAKVYAVLGKPREVRRLCVEACEYLLSERDRKKEAPILSSVAIMLGSTATSIFQTVGDYDEAIRFCDSGIDVMRGHSNQHAISMILHEKGLINQYWGDYDKALDVFEESLRIRREINDKPGIAWGLSEEGVTYRLKGDYDKALEFLEESKKLFEELRNKRGIAWTLHRIGMVYHSMHDYNNH